MTKIRKAPEGARPTADAMQKRIRQLEHELAQEKGWRKEAQIAQCRAATRLRRAEETVLQLSAMLTIADGHADVDDLIPF